MASINRYFDYLFTYEKHLELHIEKTTNRIEGLFKELKDKLRPYSGLTRKHKILFIKDFLNKRVGKNNQKYSLPTVLSYWHIKWRKTNYFVLYA
ncbi:hypothetical protein [Mannheimia pernigra]|uniref:hypothetical protein n=1 Tax=Mannheimia pernigra TaxID=111844 RepID=UPI00159F5884|nr:hypothetical protein [Mannheimia pernigra]QLB43463.1 hypothetical protein HV561_01075 [Mannheimia pernigra]